MRSLVPRVATYEAYAGPDVGGFGLVPQSSIPDFGVSEATRKMYLGDELTPPHPLTGTNPAKWYTGGTPPAGAMLPGRMTQPTPVSAATGQRDAPVRTLVPRMAEEVPTSGLTVAPKGQAPRQGSVAEAAALNLAVPGMMRPIPPAPTQGEAFNRALGNQGIRWLTNLPNVPSRIINSVVGTDVLPDVTSAEPEEIRAAFGPSTAAEEFQKSGELSKAFPWTTMGGEVAGDIAGIALTKRPVQGALKRGEIQLTNKAREAEHLLAHPPTFKPLAESGRKLWQQKISSPRFLKAARGAGRVGETTVEGLVIGAINDESPITTATMAGVGQGVGGGVLHLSNLAGPTKSKVANALMKAAIAGGTWHLLTSGFVLPDLETGFDKVKLGVGAAALALLAGTGRARTGVNTAVAPVILDSLAAIPRTGLISLANQWLKSDVTTQQRMQQAIDFMQANPESPITQRLSQAMDKGGDTFVRIMNRNFPQ